MSDTQSISESVDQLERDYHAERLETDRLRREVIAQESLIREKHDEIRSMRDTLLIYRWLSIALTAVLAVAVAAVALNWNC